MATRRPKKVEATADPKVKPIRLDLDPKVHKALRMKAAERDMSMAALARLVIAQYLGIDDEK